MVDKLREAFGEEGGGGGDMDEGVQPATGESTIQVRSE